jgi:CHAD domain
MARAVRVRGIRPKAPLRDNARKIIATRLEELLSWRAALTDPRAIQDLHDMRIAAKRLRYALEMFDICFPAAKKALDQLTEIQESIGDIHDLDVLVDLMRHRLQAMDSTTEQTAVEIIESDLSSSEKSNKLRQALYSQARDRRRLGLIGLIADSVVERSRKFAKFQEVWGGVALDSFATELLGATQIPSHVSGTAAQGEALPSDTATDDVTASPVDQPGPIDREVAVDRSDPSELVESDGSVES